MTVVTTARADSGGIALMAIGLTLQRYGDGISEPREILTAITDMMIAVACAESALMRASVSEGRLAPLHADSAAILVNEAAGRIEASAKQVFAALGEGDTLRTHQAALRRLLTVTPVDTVVRRRRLADGTVRRGSYIFQ
jgi:hypothetical protein